MSTAMKEQSDARKLADLIDDLVVVRDKLAAVRAACRAADGPEATAGLDWIVGELHTEVAGALDTLDGVWGGVREMESESSATFSGENLEDLMETLAVAGYILAGVADGNYNDGREVAKAAYRRLDEGIVAVVKTMAGVDDEQEWQIAKAWIDQRRESLGSGEES